MSEKDENIIREHAFDGIQEYDNNLPRWWVWSFILCIIWSVFYGMHYHWMGTGKVGVDSLNEENRRALAIQVANSGGALSEDLLQQLSHDPARIAAGKWVFVKANCAMCHGPEAYGVIGPNLRDDFWIYDTTMTSIVETIRDGRINKTTNMQMPPQGSLLSQDDIYSLAAYVVDLNRNTKKVANKTAQGKIPEGELKLIEY